MLRPEDRVAVKPHAAPVFHAIQYLMGNQTLEKLENFRGYGGAQSYPSRTKDTDDVDFSTGSVGLGVAFTAFASLVQDYIRAKDWAQRDRPEGRMVALVGDAELDEGNVYECLLEGWKHGLRNTWWIIDYNRQSLDGVVREGLYERIEAIFARLRLERRRTQVRRAAARRLRRAGRRHAARLDRRLPEPALFGADLQGGAAWRERLMDEIGDQGDVSALLERRSDAELGRTDGQSRRPLRARRMAEAFAAVDHDRPTCFIAYTVKGWGTPLAGHKDNHAGQMTTAQMAALRRRA